MQIDLKESISTFKKANKLCNSILQVDKRDEVVRACKTIKTWCQFLIYDMESVKKFEDAKRARLSRNCERIFKCKKN